MADHELQSASIQNLDRLGLIQISDSSHMYNKVGYYDIMASEEYSELISKYEMIDMENGWKFCLDKKIVESTPMGVIFQKICLQNIS